MTATDSFMRSEYLPEIVKLNVALRFNLILANIWVHSPPYYLMIDGRTLGLSDSSNEPVHEISTIWYMRQAKPPISLRIRTV